MANRGNRRVPGSDTPEIVAAFSVATDLGMGQPLEFALCACVLAVRLGDALGMGEAALRGVYYQAPAALYRLQRRDARAGRHRGRRAGAARRLRRRRHRRPTAQMMGLMLRYMRQANAGASPLAHWRGRWRAACSAFRRYAGEFFGGHCEVAQRLAGRLGFDERIIDGLGQLYERWDGRGLPRGI